MGGAGLELDHGLRADPGARPEVMVPGHGPIAELDEVRELRAYFEYLYEQARVYKADGMTPLQSARAIALDRWADWGERERLVVNITTIYGELSGSRSRSTRWRRSSRWPSSPRLRSPPPEMADWRDVRRFGRPGPPSAWHVTTCSARRNRDGKRERRDSNPRPLP